VIPMLLALDPPASAGVEEGRAIYVAKCQACHGAEGHGDGPAARALPKRPRDLATASFWANTTEAQVRAVITSGLPGTIMRGFPMPASQLDDLVAYVRSLAPAR
jgi:mono/diheme cytochrome c family protein